MRQSLFGLLVLFATSLPLAATAADNGSENSDPEVPKEILVEDIPINDLALRLTPLTVSELAAAAEAWRELVKSHTHDVVAAQIAAISSEDEESAAAARESLTQLADRRNELFERYSTVVDSWDKKGGDEKAIEEFRAYRNSIIVEETRTSDWQTLAVRAIDWLISPDGGIQLAIDISVVVAALFGLLFIARIVRRTIRRHIVHVPNLSKLLQTFVVGVIYWLVLAFGLMVVLSALGVDITPVFALVGGASFILAFAFQDTLGNLASGLMIMINRPFDEGDYVDVGGVAGKVSAVSIVATTVITPDNQVIVIPNKSVWGNTIRNVTSSDTRRVDLTFGVGYNDDIETVQRVLEEVLTAHPLVLDDPAPIVRVGALGASSVDFIARPWVNTVDYWTVYWDLTRQVKEAFDAAGISIPFPQQDVHIKELAPIKTQVDPPPASPTGSSEPSKSEPAPPRDAASAMAQGDS
jgi:small conductance mechanosensitive channel